MYLGIVSPPAGTRYWGSNPPRYIGPRPQPVQPNAIDASPLPGTLSVSVPPLPPQTSSAPPTLTPPPQPIPAPTTMSANPVPAGWPTTSTFIDSSGNVWAYSGSSWVNYGTSSNAANQAALVANAQAQAIAASGASTTSPAPVTVTNTTTSGYQDILTWLSDSDLLGNLGISGIPNWIPALGAGLLIAKVFSGQKGRR
jgi:hypothetical protein